MMMRTVIGIGLTAVAIYLAVGALMFVFQRTLIYRPSRLRIEPSEAGLAGVSEITLSTPDGARLIAWRSKPRAGRPTILYFHGNGGHLSGRSGRIETFQAAGFGVLMVAYRGYSGSSGSPSETANVADAVMAYDWLHDNGTAPRDIVLFGESLGTGVATQVALARPAAGLVLDSPFTSLADAAQWHYPWLPVKRLIADRYDVLGRIGAVHIPLLILHGGADAVVPLFMGRAVFAAANEPKRMFTFAGAQHLYHTHLGSLDRVREFVNSLAADAAIIPTMR